VSSVVSQTVILEAAAGYERANTPGFSIPYYEREVSLGRDTVPPDDPLENKEDKEDKEEKEDEDEEEMVYPSGLRFWLIFLCLVLSAIPSSLDRTILSAAMYPPCRHHLMLISDLRSRMISIL
jgi:hypothetical protein